MFGKKKPDSGSTKRKKQLQRKQEAAKMNIVSAFKRIKSSATDVRDQSTAETNNNRSREFVDDPDDPEAVNNDSEPNAPRVEDNEIVDVGCSSDAVREQRASASDSNSGCDPCRPKTTDDAPTGLELRMPFKEESETCEVTDNKNMSKCSNLQVDLGDSDTTNKSELEGRATNMEASSSASCSQADTRENFSLGEHPCALPTPQQEKDAEIGRPCNMSAATGETRKNPGVKADDPVNSPPTDSTEFGERVRRGPYRPVLDVYPRTKIGDRQRSFQSDWFKKYDWLEYSEELDAAFCFCCRMFPFDADGSHVNDAFIRNGVRYWKNATATLKDHALSACHATSYPSWQAYLKEKDVGALLDKENPTLKKKLDARRQKNREIMERLVNIVKMLAIGGRPFRGHREGSDAIEKGLFLDIVELLGQYDPVLADHLQNGPRNALYTSGTIQNDLIAALHNVIFQKIIDELRGKTVTIIADETSDVGHHEQMAVVIRHFSEKKNRPVETFVGLRRVTQVDAESIFNTLDGVVKDLKIVWSNVQSECFDGASAMSGEFTGVQARCKEKNPDIIYIHCFAHCLNLALVDSCISRINNAFVFDFFGTLQIVYNFIEGSPVRHAVLEKFLSETSKKSATLKSLSTTRFFCRAEASSALKNQLQAVVRALQEIRDTTKNPEAKVSARGVLSNVLKFDFVLGLEVINPILQEIKKVSAILQGEEIDLVSAMEAVSSLWKTLSDRRTEECFRAHFKAACKTFEEISSGSVSPEETENRQRKVSRKIDPNWDNQYHPESREEELRCSGFYPFLDSLIQGLEERFSQESMDLIRATGRLLRLIAEDKDLELLAHQFKVPFDELKAEYSLISCSCQTCVPKTDHLARLVA